MRFSSITLLYVAQTVIANSFVVQLKDSATVAQVLEQDDRLSIASHLRSQVYKTIKIGKTFEAFVGDFSNDAVERMKNNPLIHDILPNLQFSLFDPTTTTLIGNQTKEDKEPKTPEDKGQDEGEDDVTDGLQIQKNAPRHLARLSSRKGLYELKTPFKYKYDTTGKDIVAYVIDTGIDIKHPEFEGRAIKGASFVNESDGDLNGHGTHVSGIIGSKTYGVAKDVELVEVKVINQQGSGDLTSILEGIQWAVNDRQKRKVKAVANMSLGAFFSGILNDAVNAAFETGLVIVSAAGNSNARASMFSPASAEHSLTVGALDDRTDTIAVFSNYGDRVHVFASGVEVESLDIKNYDKPVLMSGTSMASPVVAGLVATLLEKGIKPEQMTDKVISLSTEGIINMSKLSNWKYRNTPNRIAFNGAGEKDAFLKKEPFAASPYDQDSGLLKYINDLSSIQPKDKVSIDLIERSTKIHGVKFF